MTMRRFLDKRMFTAIYLLLLALSVLHGAGASTIGDDCTAGATICNTAGHFCDTLAEVGTANTCQLVPVDFYSVINSGTKSACGTGYMTASPGAGGNTAQEACVCDLGYGRTSNADACIECVAGFYKTAAGDAVCTGCAVGTYYDTDLAYDSATDQCATCGAGYSTSATGTTGTDIQVRELCKGYV